MDKYTSKTSFQEWLSPIKLTNLSAEAQLMIQQFNYSGEINNFKKRSYL